MKSQRSLIFVPLFICICSSFVLAQQIQVENIGGRPAAGHEVIVKLRAGIANSALQTGPMVEAEMYQAGGNSRLYRVRSEAVDTTTLLNEMKRNSAVEWAEPNYVIEAFDTMPNDPNFSNLWGLNNTGQIVNNRLGKAMADIQALKAWSITTGTQNVVVGVIDSGIDYNHPDLAGNMWTAQQQYQLNVGSSNITCPAGTHGFNAITLTCDPMDDFMHGTHVAGIIGAQGNNSLGVTGVNWKTSIVAFKFLGSNGTGYTFDAVLTIQAAIQMKAQGVNIRVLNASWGSNSESAALKQAIDEAGANDILFVAAAGNSARSNDLVPSYPAAYTSPYQITVAASDSDDTLASFSNWGVSTVQVAAPGVNIQSTMPNNSYAFLSGTSMASPHVAGSAALILSACQLSTQALRTIVMNGIDPIPSHAGMTATGGRINVYRSLTMCGGNPTPSFTLSASPAAVSVSAGGSAQTSISAVPANGFNGSVQLTTGALPAGITASYSSPYLIGSGASTLTLSALSSVMPGNYPITVQGWSGTLNASTTVTLTVGGGAAGDFGLGLSPASISVASGSSAATTLGVSCTNGFNGAVNLSTASAPTGLSVSFSPTSVSGCGNSTITVSVAASTVAGSYPVIVQGASGSTVHSATISVAVTSQADFTVAASPSSITAGAGGSAISTISISGSNGFSGNVSLSISGAPAGVNASFAPPSLTGSGASALTLSVAASTAAGSYPLTVIAVSGGISHTTTINLNVASSTSIVLPSGMTMDPGAQLPYLISLSAPAPSGGAFIMLTISDPSVVALNVTSIFIPEGQNNSSRARITGLSAGSATIVATAAGFGTASGQVQVGAAQGMTMTFSPATLTMAPAATQSLTLVLSKPAPAAGLTVTLSSSNPAVIASPASVVVPYNSTSVQVPITGMGGGSATLTASAAPLCSPTKASVTVMSSLTINTSSLPAGQVGSGYTATLSATGGTQPYQWALLSGTLPSGLTFNTATGQIIGTPTAATNTTLAFKVTDASAPAQSATAQLSLTITAGGGGGGSPTSIAAAGGTPQSTPINAAFSGVLVAVVRDAAGNPLSGVTVTFNAPASGPSARFANGASYATAVTNASGIAVAPALTANANPGSYSVFATVAGVGAPACFELTNIGGAAVLLPAVISVGVGAQAAIPITLSAPAPAGGAFVTLTISDPTVATPNLYSAYIPEGQTTSTRPRVNGLRSGTATLTVAVDGYSPSSTQVQVQ